MMASDWRALLYRGTTADYVAQQETPLMRSIRAAVVAMGYPCWRNNTGFDHTHKVRYGLAVGSADLIAVVNGRFCALEVKTKTGRTASDQAIWAQVVRDHGGFACTVRSVNEAISAISRCQDGLYG